MGVIVRRGEHDFEPIPLGLCDAVCANVFDLGKQRGWDNEAPKHRVVLLFELSRRQSNGKRFTIAKEFTASLHERALLTAFLEDWRGRPFTREELDGFDLDKIVGAPCSLNIVEKENQRGEARAAIGAVLKIQRGVQPLVAETPKDYMPGWVRKRIETQILEDARSMQGAAHSTPARGQEAEFADDIPF